MALHVALNRTPKDEEKKECCECVCDGSEDFTLEDMHRVQEETENSKCNLREMKCKINQILWECAQVAGLRAVRLMFCGSKIFSNSDDVRVLIAKNISKTDLEELAAWLRNNGYSTSVSWDRNPLGALLGSILVYW